MYRLQRLKIHRFAIYLIHLSNQNWCWQRFKFKTENRPISPLYHGKRKESCILPDYIDAGYTSIFSSLKHNDNYLTPNSIFMIFVWF